jgi:deazaflavin-dependent oxidoreductase (nitroreductase family)
VIPPGLARAVWKVFNPVAIFLAQWVRLWAVIETTGRVTATKRLTPVANNVRDGALWVVAVHGRRAAYIRNVEAEPRVRVRIGRTWYVGTAELLPIDGDTIANVNGYARASIPVVGRQPVMLRIALER